MRTLPKIVGAYTVPTGPFLLPCLCCPGLRAELAKPCPDCGVVYDEHALPSRKRRAA